MTTRIYKLTDQNSQTMKTTQWGIGVSHETSGKGELCSGGWLHAYTHPLLAVLLNPIHADIENPQLWLAYGSGQRLDGRGLKVGFTKMKTVKRMKLPVISNVQRTAFGILCTLEVCKGEQFVKWAKAWLDGSDRSGAAADAYFVADAAYFAADAASAAAYASVAASASAAAAGYASSSAAYAASAASASASSSAAYAAYYAARTTTPINLIDLVKKAMKYG